MTNIYNFGAEAALKCRSEPGFKEAINKFLQVFCNEQKTFLNSNELYNCNPFVHQVYAINDECPDGYTQIASNTLNDNNTVNTCMGIISDATAGENLSYSNCFAEYIIK